MKRRSLSSMIVLAALMVSANAASVTIFAPRALAQGRTAAAVEQMPLRDVVLFSSGVGYFGRSGSVGAGEESLELRFRSENINDVLKSLVILDPKGKTRPVTYGIADLVSTRPRTSDLTLDSAATLGAILRRFQGAQIRVQTARESVEGRIISVGTRRIQLDDRTSREVEVLTLFSESGLRTVVLEDVSSVQLVDANLNKRLRESLEKMAQNVAAPALNDGTRAITIRFSGAAAREVRVGYLQETPVWKTSYRLVLDDKAKPFLQGWAVVENTTEEDWNDVNLSLVAGRPVSFTQNLLQPLYIARPEVAPQVLGVPRSQLYAEGSGNLENIIALPAPSAAPAPSAPKKSLYGASRAANNRSRSEMSAADFASEAEEKVALERRREVRLSAAELAKQSAAQGEVRGDLFEYSLSAPVTIPRDQAALVPILNNLIDGNKLTIIDVDSDDLRPMRGFMLKNSSNLHLAGGPITVFDDGIYAGDAQVTNIAPGESRLLSYALDLDILVTREDPKETQALLSIAAKAGVLTITRSLRREEIYNLKNKSEKAKTAIVQKNREDGWQLKDPKADETTADSYRFKVALPAQKTQALKIVLTHPESEEVALLDVDFDLLVQYARHGQVSPKLKNALQELVARRRKITALAQKRAQNEAEIKAISEEQERIRRNMNQVGRDSALYNTYMKKLSEQETRIENLQSENARLQREENEARSEMNRFVDTISDN